MITCQEAVRRLWDYLENDVSGPDHDAVEEHLTFCRRCCGELEFADELRGVLAAAAAVELPVDVRTRLTGVLDDLAASGGSDVDRPRPARSHQRGGGR